MTATEEKLSASSRSIPKPRLPTESIIGSTLPPQSEGIQCKDTLPLSALGGLPDVKEQMRARLAEGLTGASAVYLPTTDEDSVQDEPPQARRQSKGVSGKLRTADTIVVHRITWPHEVIYSLLAQPAIYDQVSSMIFVDWYLTVVSREPSHIKALILDHLQELMEDHEHYGWPLVRVYHTAWLQHMEQGWSA